MKLVIQRSGPANVEINGETFSEIKKGLVVLLGITHEDSEKDIEYLVEKLINMRLFDSGEKFFEKSVLEENLEVLVVSQFTLYASAKKGRRPDFALARKSAEAEPLYEKFVEKLKEKGIAVRTGVFGAMMKISLTNDGPVTIILDSSEK